MKILYTDQEFSSAKPKDEIPCWCHFCEKTFKVKKSKILRLIRKNTLNQKIKVTIEYCSRKCKDKDNTKKRTKTLPCNHCGIFIVKKLAEIGVNNYCSKSCAATYNNTHKTKGTKRSKLEKLIEENLSLFYPNLTISYNQKTVIDSELDIYISEIKLAIELNGIFHYEPIFGPDKLNKIKNNDDRKFQACLERGIELLIIDASQLKYFKPANAQKYLDIIINVIDKKLL